ncbi:MAG: hypothetical protein ACP5RS_06155 [Thermoplasmata archaeon]
MSYFDFNSTNEIKEQVLSILKDDDNIKRLESWREFFDDDYWDVLSVDDLIKIKGYYLSLLKNEDINIIVDSWDLAPALLDSGIIKISDLEQYTQHYKKFAESNMLDKRIIAWNIGEDTIHLLMTLKAINSDNKKYFFDLLEYYDSPSIHEDAWYALSDYLEVGFISLQDKEFFINFLRDNNLGHRNLAWKFLSSMKYESIITREDLITNINYFLDLLKSSDLSYRAYAWNNLIDLLDNDLLDYDDVKKLKIFYFEIIEKASKVEVLDEALESLESLLKLNIVTEEDSLFFVNMLNRDNLEMRLHMWEFIDTLLGYSIVSLEDINHIEPSLYSLLKFEDIKGRSLAWYILMNKYNEYVDIDIPTLVEYVPYYIELLKTDNEMVRSEAWLLASHFVDTDIINLEDIVKNLGYLATLAENEENKIRSNSMYALISFLELNLLKKEEVLPYKKHFLKGLKLTYPDHDNFIDIWYYAIDFLKYGVFTKLEALEYSKYYVEYLKYGEAYARSQAWMYVSDLMDEHFIIAEDVKANIEQYFELLERYEWLGDSKNSPWLALPSLIDHNIINSKYNQRFLDMLSSNHKNIMNTAWDNLEMLLKKRIIGPKDYKFFTDMLKKGYNPAVFWFYVGLLAKYKLITKNEKEYILKPLLSGDEPSKVLFWNSAHYLIENKVLSLEDVKPYSNVFLNLLKHPSLHIRWMVWYNSLDILVNDHILERDQLNGLQKYYVEFLKANSHTIRYGAWLFLYYFVEKNILPREMVKENIEYYVEVINNGGDMSVSSASYSANEIHYSLYDALLLLKHCVDTNLIDLSDYHQILKKALYLEKDSEKREEIGRFMEDLKTPSL